MKQYIWIILGAIALLLNEVFGRFHLWYEVIYYKGVFQILRYIYDYTLGMLPIPMVYFLFFLLVHLIYKMISLKGLKYQSTWLDKTKLILRRILSFIGMTIFLFYFLWGFNYQQLHLSEVMDLPIVEPDTTILYERSLDVLEKMAKLRLLISQDTLPLNKSHIPEELEYTIRKSLVSSLESWGLPAGGRVRVRTLYPKGILLRISTAGVYIPYVFEGHIDAGLHPIQYPFTMAHEMSHGYGLADEGTCNFTGFVACINNEDAFVQYSAYMSFWRYLALNLRRGSRDLYTDMMNQIDPGVRADLIAIMDEMDKYPDIMPKVRDKVYDTYLKSHGVSGGLSNYSKVVEMVFGWCESDYNPDLTHDIF